MCPFIGNPSGLSPETLKLLDRALSGIWRDVQTENTPAAAAKSAIATPKAPAKTAVDSGEHGPQRTASPSQPLAAPRARSSSVRASRS